MHGISLLVYSAYHPSLHLHFTPASSVCAAGGGGGGGFNRPYISRCYEVYNGGGGTVASGFSRVEVWQFVISTF